MEADSSDRVWLDGVSGWLMSEGRRIADAKAFLEPFALRLNEAGVDVARMTMGVPILHPAAFLLHQPVGARQGRHGAALSRGCELRRGARQQLHPERLRRPPVSQPSRRASRGGGASSSRVTVRNVRTSLVGCAPGAPIRRARHDRLLMHVQTTAPLDDCLHRRLLSSEDDRDAADKFETSMRAPNFPGLGSDLSGTQRGDGRYRARRKNGRMPTRASQC
jgi:hypothetical protein